MHVELHVVSEGAESAVERTLSFDGTEGEFATIVASLDPGFAAYFFAEADKETSEC